MNARRALLLVIVVLAVAAAGLWWFFLRGETTSEVTAPLTPASSDGVAAPGELLDVEDTTGARDLETIGATGQGTADRVTHRVPVEPGFEAPLAEGIEIVVVVAEIDEPVPHATVQFLGSSEFSDAELMGLLSEGLDFDALLAAQGRRYRADGEGRVFVPETARDSLIAGEGRGLWGLLSMKPGLEEPVPLELFPDPALAIRVIDATGAPMIDVPVALRFKTGASNLDLLSARTEAPNGLAVIRHPTRFAVLVEMDCLAAAAIPLAEPVEVALDLEDFPTEPIELRLPSTGRLEVSVRTESDQPVEELVVVQAAILPPDYEPPTDPGHVNYLPDAVSTAAGEDGLAVFEHVEAGGMLGVLVNTAGGHEPVREIVAGPGPGETVRVELRLPDTVPVLVGRLLDPSEQPVSDAVVEARVETVDKRGRMRNLSRSRLRTEHDGSFRYPLQRLALEQTGRVLVIEREGTSSGEQLGARIELALVLRPGPNELGDVILAPPPLLVAGRVESETGASVAGAELRLYFQTPGDGASWRPLWAFGTNADHEGAFAIRGWVAPGRLAVDARHPSHRPSDRLVVERGERDARLVLLAAGAIAGRVVLSEGVPAKRIVVGVRDPAAPASEGVPHSARPDADGSFEILAVSPGTWTVQIDAPDTVVTFDGVLVEAGETTRDPRLAEIDLRDLVFSFVLGVFDPEGAPVPGPRAVTIRPVPPGGPRTTWGRDGRIEILSITPAVDVTVQANGFRTRRLEGVREDTRVVLDRGIPVRLVLANARVLNDPRFVLSVVVFPVGRGPRAPLPVSAELGPGGEALFQLVDARRYRAHLHMRYSSGGESGSANVRGSNIVIDVQDTWTEQRFTIPVSADEITALRETLAKGERP